PRPRGGVRERRVDAPGPGPPERAPPGGRPVAGAAGREGRARRRVRRLRAGREGRPAPATGYGQVGETCFSEWTCSLWSVPSLPFTSTLWPTWSASFRVAAAVKSQRSAAAALPSGRVALVRTNDLASLPAVRQPVSVVPA